MSIKSNFFYNSLLTVSGYIFTLVSFPYINRVLGVENLGICNFVDSIISYFLLFANMGINTIGVLEISKNKSHPEKINTIFSSLFILNLIFTLLVIFFLLVAVFFIPHLNQYFDYFLIGLIKLVFSLFLIDWLFQGLQNFKVISLRSIIIKLIFTILIFLLIKDKSDTSLFYLLSCLMVVLNGIYNIYYSRKFVKFSLKFVKLKLYLKAFIIFGLNKVFISFYTTMLIIMLGFLANNSMVGYYTTVTKLFAIIIALFTSLTTVIIPKLNTLLYTKQVFEVNKLVKKNVVIIYTLTIPIIIFTLFYSDIIINILAGSEFEYSNQILKIIIPLVLVIGLSQVYSQQLLTIINREALLKTTFCGCLISIPLAFILINQYNAIGAAYTWLLVEIIILIISIVFVRKEIRVFLFDRDIFYILLNSVPYVLVSWIGLSFSNIILKLAFVIGVSLVYFIISQVYFLKSSSFINILKSKF
ncbi:oligosaccharide flippase family protein [Sphingobacterium sp. HJSM2_6]|uniref:oligosaccharide flippase family protein n=1 Tax=Sphingobacterium sp. HJSM2_6 TaxID=3366264 RepID=UPI003BDD2087